ncbi:hypothetical protein RFI_03946 [Reticulomyxa filosa]|uniref:Phosphoglycerate mutase family protein n=1 Tax=Reticulomyxa filosa TaxID=46433 RepID=X6P3N8_RETFI|nr:hypothetical protein RFI_03946 [Reticulomyxa filosa]|eukprot:ETO33160.1 hypothetical protein RFI_03946 [Reticulomyxa filosa]
MQKQKSNAAHVSQSSQKELSSSQRQLWLIRHGERADESDEFDSWARTVHSERWFDPPLTKTGALQAQGRGELLSEHLKGHEKLHNQFWSRVVYVSPCERTLHTAFEIAKELVRSNEEEGFGVTLAVRPGLGECASAVRKTGLCSTLDEELCLKPVFFDNKWFPSRFLKKKEILERFNVSPFNGKTCKIRWQFTYDHTSVRENFSQCVDNIMKENYKYKIAICVTHREGIRCLDDRLFRARVPYCALVKYLHHPQQSSHQSHYSNAHVARKQAFEFLTE